MKAVRIRGADIRKGDAVRVGFSWELVAAIEEGEAERFVTFASGFRRPFRVNGKYDVIPGKP